MAGMASPANAAEQFGPVGAPIDIDVNHAAQLAIVGGTGAAVNGIVCVTTDGAGCAVTPAILAVVTPFVHDAVVCPNNGIRRIHAQPYSAPPSPHATDGSYTKISGSECIPA